MKCVAVCPSKLCQARLKMTAINLRVISVICASVVSKPCTGNFNRRRTPYEQLSKPSKSSENIFHVSINKGKEQLPLYLILQQLSFSVPGSDLLLCCVCRTPTLYTVLFTCKELNKLYKNKNKINRLCLMRVIL